MTQRPTADASDMHAWTPAIRFDDFALSCCGKRHLHLASDPDSFALTQRAGRMGPVTLAEIVVGSDVSMLCSEGCNNYRVFVLQSGRTECVDRGGSVSGRPGTAAVLAPQDHADRRKHRCE